MIVVVAYWGVVCSENEAYVAVDDVQFYAMTPLSASQMAGRPAHVMFIHSCGPPSVGVRRPGGPGPVPPSYDEVMAASHAWQAPLSTVNEQVSDTPPASDGHTPTTGGSHSRGSHRPQQGSQRYHTQMDSLNNNGIKRIMNK